MTLPDDPAPPEVPGGPTPAQQATRDALYARLLGVSAASRAYLAVKQPNTRQMETQTRVLSLAVASLARLVVGDFDSPLEDVADTGVDARRTP